MANQSNAQRRRTHHRNGGKFWIPRTKQQFQTCLQRMSLQFFNVLFKFADKAMYLLGPLLIALASVIIVGLTYVYFRVILPMLAGSNWVMTNDDWNSYWKDRGYGAGTTDGGKMDGSAPIWTASPIIIALSTPTGILHTLLVFFFLANILYNYYRCVVTSNSGPRYDSVVRELAEATGFRYPESEEELVQCKKDFERKIYEKVQRRRNEMLAARSRNNNSAGESAPPAPTPSGAAAPANAQNNGDEDSQAPQPSPLMATSTPNPSATAAAAAPTNAPQPMPKIHNWQLLSPVEWGYCRYSSRPKPPRSHYDHVTRSLVLNMDHYCPWMFNCIGYFNYRYFFNFLWFVTVALWYGAAITFPAFMNLGSVKYRDQVRASGGYKRSLRESLISVVVRHVREDPYIPTPDERTPVALGFMLCLCLAAAVMCLGGFHLYLVLTAQTTIEFHGNWSKRKKVGWKNPYSAGGWKKNWEMIYGTVRRSPRGASTDEDRYKYCGCCGVLMAMMPSSREPEFLPLPIDGKLVRRRKRNATEDVTDEEETDIEMASSEAMSNGAVPQATMEGTEFLMEPKEANGHGRLVGRAKANKASEGRIV